MVGPPALPCLLPTLGVTHQTTSSDLGLAVKVQRCNEVRVKWMATCGKRVENCEDHTQPDQ